MKAESLIGSTWKNLRGELRAFLVGPLSEDVRRDLGLHCGCSVIARRRGMGIVGNPAFHVLESNLRGHPPRSTNSHPHLYNLFRVSTLRHCRRLDSNQHTDFSITDFKSVASAISPRRHPGANRHDDRHARLQHPRRPSSRQAQKKFCVSIPARENNASRNHHASDPARELDRVFDGSSFPAYPVSGRSRRFGIDEHVTGRTHRADEARVLRIVAQLAS